MANLFLLSRKAFVMCYSFRAPIKTFFFDACQMTVKCAVDYIFNLLCAFNSLQPMKKFVFSVACRATGSLQFQPSGSGDENVIDLESIIPLKKLIQQAVSKLSPLWDLGILLTKAPRRAPQRILSNSFFKQSSNGISR